MLAITAKARLLKQEVTSAKSICKDIIGTLLNVTDDTDFKKEIGIFAIQAPNWKILTDERRQMQDLIRKVCTGEVYPNEAIVIIREALVELEWLDKWLQIPLK